MIGQGITNVLAISKEPKENNSQTNLRLNSNVFIVLCWFKEPVSLH